MKQSLESYELHCDKLTRCRWRNFIASYALYYQHKWEWGKTESICTPDIHGLYILIKCIAQMMPKWHPTVVCIWVIMLFDKKKCPSLLSLIYGGWFWMQLKCHHYHVRWVLSFFVRLQSLVTDNIESFWCMTISICLIRLSVKRSLLNVHHYPCFNPSS